MRYYFPKFLIYFNIHKYKFFINLLKYTFTYSQPYFFMTSYTYMHMHIHIYTYFLRILTLGMVWFLCLMAYKPLEVI